MGRDIGDYIHYHASNYKYWGIRERGEGDGGTNEYKNQFSTDYNTAKISLKKLWGKKILHETAQQLQAAINAYQIANWNITDYTDIKDETAQSVYDNLQKLLPFIQVELSNLSSSGITNQDALLKKIVDDLDTYTGVTNTTSQKPGDKSIRKRKMSEISRKITWAIKHMSQYIQTANISGAQKTGILNCQNELKNIQQDLKQMIKQNKEKGLIKLGTTVRLDEQGNEITLVDVFKQYNQIVRSMQGPSAYGNGVIGEYGIAGLIAACYGSQTEVSAELIEKFVVGGNKSKTFYKNLSQKYIDNNKLLDLFNTFIRKDEQGNKKIIQSKIYEIMENGETIASLKESQDTVDITIPIDATSEIAREIGSEAINASVKNYSQVGNGHNIHILSGAPLLSILMLLETNFVNHYINLIVQHPTEKKADYKIDHVTYDDATDLVELAAATRALNGNRELNMGLNTNTSQFFIVNNRSKAKNNISVYSTYELLDRFDNIDHSLISVKGIPNQSSIANTHKGSRNNATDAQTRITQVIANIHRRKLYLSMNGDQLNQI